jgi:hypothetical protein
MGQVVDFCAAAWPNFTPALTGCRFNKFGPDGRDAIDFWHYPKEVLLDLDDGLA